MDTTQSFFSLWAYRLYVAGLFLLPVAVATSVVVPFQSFKLLIAALALGGALGLALIAALRQGRIAIPMNWVAASFWLVPLMYALSALFSPGWLASFIGGQLDTDTVFFMALLAIAVSLPLYLFVTRADYVRAFFAVLVSSWVVALFQLIRLVFGANALSFGIFTNPLFTVIGKWNDLGIFFGFIATLAIITLEALPLSEMNRWVLRGTLVVSLFFVATVNYAPVWILLGLLSFGIVLYRALLAPKGTTKMSWVATIVLVLALVGTLFAGSAGAYLGSVFGTTQIEARPSFGSTIVIASNVLKHSPVFGTGPNGFLLAWDQYRPAVLNQSIFWNADFTSGVGFIPTSWITGGILAGLAWLLFIVLFVMAGVRSLLMKPTEDSYAYYLLVASFVAGLYTLIISIAYLPSPVILLIGFSAIGMFIALDHQERKARTYTLVFTEHPRWGFVAVLSLSLKLLILAASLYGVGTVFAANIYYERASLTAQQGGDLATAATLDNQALALSPQERFHRLGVLIELTELQNGIDVADKGTPEDAQKNFQTHLGAAVEHGLAAVRSNQFDYRNWQALASAYHSVVSLNINGAYDSAVAAYTKAAALNPQMPAIPFARAQLEIARGDRTAARPFIDQALALKADYVPALLLLAQIELTDGNLDAAIKQAEAASVFEPSNPVTQFQVGVLKYEKKDLAGAEKAFTNALTIAPNYANARYYLGRVKFDQGKKDDAVKEFQEVLKLNPDSADVIAVIAAIQAGKDPFAATPPATTPKK